MNERVKEALLSVSENVFLFTAKGNQNLPYIVYGVDGENHLFASNRRAELCDAGYIDLFTKNGSDPLIKSVPEALELAGIAFYIQFSLKNKQICCIMNGVGSRSNGKNQNHVFGRN